MTTYYVLGKTARGKYTAILAEAQSLEGAEAFGVGCTAADYDIQSDLAKLSLTALAELHNGMAPKADAVTRFADKPSAVRRVMMMFAAYRAEPLAAEKKPRGSKPQARKITGKITLLPMSKSDDKIWHKSSARFAVLGWLREHAPVDKDLAVQAIMHSSSFSRAQVCGCIAKLAQSKCIAISED